MNRLDSELVEGCLVRCGHEMTADRRSADVLLYNTCSVRAHAEDKVYSRLGRDAQRRGARRRPLIGVLGCMAQRLGDRFPRRCPAVDIVCSPGNLYRLDELIDAAARGRRAVAVDPPRNAPRDPDAESRTYAMDSCRDPRRAAAASRAFVRITRGCDRFCTYCVVPFVRGPERSCDPQAIVEEVGRLVDAGRTEITLLGQTVNRYRWEAGGRTVRFSDLLKQVSSIGGVRRLRFVTSHPLDFGNDVLEAVRDLPNVCEYVHCPAQSGSDPVLKRMGRGYTRAQYDDLVDRARDIVPGVVLAGDFIVGFPGETEADHRASAELIRRSGYKNCFIFKYSPRPGTAAADKLTDDVAMDVKRRRNSELLAVQTETSLAHHAACVGRVVEVLVEGRAPRAHKQPTEARPGQTQLTGRTRGDHVVVFDGPQSLAGQYVDVRVEDANALTLFGRRAQ